MAEQRIITHPQSKEYSDGWDAIWGKKSLEDRECLCSLCDGKDTCEFRSPSILTCNLFVADE